MCLQYTSGIMGAERWLSLCASQSDPSAAVCFCRYLSWSGVSLSPETPEAPHLTAVIDSKSHRLHFIRNTGPTGLLGWVLIDESNQPMGKAAALDNHQTWTDWQAKYWQWTCVLSSASLFRWWSQNLVWVMWKPEPSCLRQSLRLLICSRQSANVCSSVKHIPIVSSKNARKRHNGRL